ncbi:peroxiredoxin family protein [Zhongshania guokunii]|uniref:Peroxiredoxin family protein n=1 Tax=Zhongshania guokunii TaxID=641783 RepID=A0ABV3U7E3_9GAMM
MDRLKSLFISAWMTLLMLGAARSGWAIYKDPSAAAWYWALFCMLAPLAFFAWIFTFNVARTQVASKAVLGITLFTLLGAVLSPVIIEALAWILGAGVLGTVLYEWWYSSFGERHNEILSVGQILPDLEFIDAAGKEIETGKLNKPMLMIFYRGNWCPLCMAQIKEIAGQYRELAAKGVEIMLISPQSQSHTVDLAQRFEAPMSFLVDTDNAMAKRLGIAAANGLPLGMEVLGYDSDTVMPTVIMTDSAGKILFADLTDNYRVRPEPEIFLQVFAQAGI